MAGSLLIGCCRRKRRCWRESKILLLIIIQWEQIRGNKILADAKKFTDSNVGGNDDWLCHLDGIAQ
jgi:hypothetical protein